LNKPKKYEYAIKWNSVFSKEWVKNDKNLIANGVDLKVLLRYDEETKEDILKWLKVHKNIREIKNMEYKVSFVNYKQQYRNRQKLFLALQSLSRYSL